MIAKPIIIISLTLNLDLLISLKTVYKSEFSHSNSATNPRYKTVHKSQHTFIVQISRFYIKNKKIPE